MNQDNPMLNATDHDILIRLTERVGNVVEEMRLMRDGTERRLQKVEESKLDKSDFTDYKVTLKQELLAMETNIMNGIRDKSLARDKERDDAIERMDAISLDIKSMWRYIWTGIAITLVAAAIFSVVGPQIFSRFFHI